VLSKGINTELTSHIIKRLRVDNYAYNASCGTYDAEAEEDADANLFAHRHLKSTEYDKG
jgi:hypothetical protein